MSARLLQAGLAAALLAALAACTQDAKTPAPPAPSSSSSDPATTAPTTTLTQVPQRDAKLKVSIEQLRGGIKRKQWPALERVVSRPIARWIAGAYAGSYPRASYADAFTGWTSGARRLAKRDQRTTTNSAVGKKLVELVVDKRVVKLYIFASRGRTGGATAQVNIAVTGENQGGSMHSYAVTGRLYLLRDANRWRIFGYDLVRREVKS